MVLTTIELRADKATANNIDTTAVRALITSVETNIVVARAVIAEQVSKIYTINIDSESTAKTSVENARNLLKTDIEAMNSKIKIAYEALKKTAEALRNIHQINDMTVPESTTTNSETDSIEQSNTQTENIIN